MGFSANFVSITRMYDDQNQEVLQVTGVSEETKMAEDAARDSGREPWNSLTPADVTEMFVAVVDTSRVTTELAQVLGAKVQFATATGNWSVEIKPKHPHDPPLPAKDTQLLVVGTTTFNTFDGQFCWAEWLSVE